MESLRVYASDSDSENDVPLSNPGAEGASPGPEKEGDRAGDAAAMEQPSVVPVRTIGSSPPSLPPPPDDLLGKSAMPGYEGLHRDRIRTFPHVDGNYALHVYIPVTVPSHVKNEVVSLMDKAFKLYPGLQSMEEINTSPPRRHAAGAEGCKLRGEYHISLSRTVPIRIPQIESITALLRHKFSHQKKFIVDFGHWEVFINDEQTRTFLSVEIARSGLPEIHRQASLVDDVFGLHNLPKFYKNPRPHISLAWALGDVTSSLTRVSEELNKFSASAKRVVPKSLSEISLVLWTSQVKKVECKVGQRVYPVWASP